MAKMRVTITISDELKVFYEEMADKMGVSQSAIMGIALQSYKDQRETLDNMGNIKSILDKLEQMTSDKK